MDENITKIKYKSYRYGRDCVVERDALYQVGNIDQNLSLVLMTQIFNKRKSGKIVDFFSKSNATLPPRC